MNSKKINNLLLFSLILLNPDEINNILPDEKLHEGKIPSGTIVRVDMGNKIQDIEILGYLNNCRFTGEPRIKGKYLIGGVFETIVFFEHEIL